MTTSAANFGNTIIVPVVAVVVPVTTVLYRRYLWFSGWYGYADVGFGGETKERDHLED